MKLFTNLRCIPKNQCCGNSISRAINNCPADGNLVDIALFFHDLKHHPCTQLKAVLEQQVLRYSLKLPYTILIPGEQLLLFIRYGGPKFFLVPVNQLKCFLILLAQWDIVVPWLDISVSKFFKKSHATSSTYISSRRMVFSARLLMLFIALTQVIWSFSFNFSVTVHC